MHQLRECNKSILSAQWQPMKQKNNKRITTLNWSVVKWIHTAPATETVDLNLIPGRVKQKTWKIGIQSFPAWRLFSNKRGSVKPPQCVVDRCQLAACTARSLRCLLATMTWQIKSNYITLRCCASRKKISAFVPDLVYYWRLDQWPDTVELKLSTNKFKKSQSR